jgi:TRAP-type C4-dicarboxylate transport system permease large subunit
MTLCTLVWWRYRDDDLRHVSRASGREIARALVIALPALALPFVIRYAVVEGIATATEVSTIGIVYGVVIGLLVYRRFDWRRLMPMLSETACLSGAILLIIGTATAMAWGLTQSGFSRALATAMTGLPGAMIIILAMGIGLFAPPFGVGYYAACAIGRVDPAEGIRPIWGYLLALLVGLIVVAIFPWISIGFL